MMHLPDDIPAAVIRVDLVYGNQALSPAAATRIVRRMEAAGYAALADEIGRRDDDT